ncbi:MAG: hypothetical protein CSA81_08380 [Acidobacteria bacterium]|nr:MAG: hypothetical protein CSA81_08380 [Acidobacteriota bacterium]PIE89741.1 MAG: hypothetical protein CR997_09915 [Acidobacteriota bacterium]
MKTKSPQLTILPFVLFQVFAFLLFTKPVLANESWPEEGPWVVKAYYPNLEKGRAMASLLAPWEFHQNEGYFLLEVNMDLMDRLVEEGFQLELDLKKTEKLAAHRHSIPGQRAGIPGYPCYRTVEETYLMAQQLVSDYPDLAEWTEIGSSWEKTQDPDQGYPIMVLHLSNRQITVQKPVFMAISAIHSREYTTAELMSRFAEYLLENYGRDADATWLLDYRDIYLVLHANPDGRKKAETGLSWRKNTNSDECSSGTAPDGPGIDLNRNFPFQWNCCGGSSSSPCSVTYHGSSAASEPETQAIIDFARLVIPDQRADDLVSPAPLDTVGVFLDIHSYGGDVLWPWGYSPSTPPPNENGLYRYARKLAYFNGYNPGGSFGAVDGATKDFAYGEFGVPSYTIELGTAFFQDCSVFENTILPDNIQMMLYAIKSCSAPYMISKGPNAHSIAYTQMGQAQGKITATFDDSLYATSNGTEPYQNIVETRLTIGTPPFITGSTPLNMTPVDGQWDHYLEQAEADIDLTSLGVGSHPVFVQGKDADGNWGSITSCFIHVLSDTTYIEGTIREEGSYAPVTATVRAGDFETTSDAGGAYRLYVTPGTYDLEFTAENYRPETVMAVQVQENQAVTSNIYLKPYCAFFEDDFEQGLNGWTADGSWAISDEDVHAGTYAWSDSPGGNYTANQDTYLVSPILDLTDAEDVNLSFWCKFDLETGYDYVYLEYRIDGGSWVREDSFNGTQSNWELYSTTLPALNNQSNVQIRFYLHSDGSVFGDGFHLDDFTLKGTGPSCSQEMSWEVLLESWPTFNILYMISSINNQP